MRLTTDEQRREWDREIARDARPARFWRQAAFVLLVGVLLAICWLSAVSFVALFGG